MLSNKGRHETTKLGSSVVQEFKINQRRILIDSLEIGIPAPEQMIALGERQLPNGVKVGQLLNSKTLNYKKLTPHRDGLFCERIFGPVQSFVCACGKNKSSVQNKSRQKDIVKTNLLPPATGVDALEMAQNKSGLFTKNEVSAKTKFNAKAGLMQKPSFLKDETVKTEVNFCPKCQVEYISKNVRRHRLGYIKLFAPVTHIWYLKGRPSYLSLFLGKRKKAITSLAYCNAYLVEQVCSDVSPPNLLKDTEESASALVRKGNVKIWQNLHSKNANKGNEKTPFLKDFQDSVFSIRKRVDLDLPVVSKQTKNFDLDLKEVETRAAKSDCSVFDLGNEYRQTQGLHQRGTDVCNDGNNRNLLSKTQKDFHNRIALPNSYSESFFSLLIQLFPETVTQELQTKSQETPTRLLEVDSIEVQSAPVQSFSKGVELGFATKTKFLQAQRNLCQNLHASKNKVKLSKAVDGGDINLNRVPNWNKKLATQDVESLNLSTKRLKYKVSTKLEAVKYFVETALGITNKSFDNSQLVSVKRDPLKVLRTPYLRAQALPFLPSLICSFHLRDCLISFLQSLPCREDIPIPMYCRTPRRYPLRDVHKFLAELRSTNATNQAEILTTESITKFLGRANQKHSQDQAVRRASKSKGTFNAKASFLQTLPFPERSSMQKLRFCKGIEQSSGKQRLPEPVKFPKTPFLRAKAKFVQASHIKDLRTNQANAYSKSFAWLVSTSSLQPFKEDPPGSYTTSVTSTFGLKKEHRDIVVHKVCHASFFSQSRVNPFLPISSEDKNRAHPILTRENRVDTVRKSGAIQSAKSGAERSFIGRGTRIKKRVLTPNWVSIDNLIKNTLYNQTVTQFIPGHINQNCQKGISEALRTHLISNAKVPEREIRRYKRLPKLALLPLGFNLIANSTYTCNSFVTSLPSNTKEILGGVAFNKKDLKSKLLYPKRGFSGFSRSTQLLARDTQISLRGVLLNTFLDMIRAKFVDFSLPLSVSQFQIHSVKQRGLRRQQKQTITSLNSETVITSNQISTKLGGAQIGLWQRNGFGAGTQLLGEKTAEFLLAKVQAKVRQSFVTGSQLFAKLGYSHLGRVLLTNSQADSRQSQVNLGFVDNKTDNQLYKGQNKKSDNLQLYSNQIFSPFNTKLFTRRCYGVMDLKTGENSSQHLSKKRTETKYKPQKFTYVYVPTLLYARELNFENKQFGLNKILFSRSLLRYKYRYGLTLNLPSQTSAEAGSHHVYPGIVYNAPPFQDSFSSGVHSDLQAFFFKKRIDTYQARLLHIVFRALPKTVFCRQLTSTRSHLLRNHDVLVQKQNKNLSGTQGLGCTYLLTKYRQDPKPEKLFKKKGVTKPLFWYTCSQSCSTDAMQKQGSYDTSKAPLPRAPKQLWTKTPFLCKAGVLESVKGREKVNERDRKNKVFASTASLWQSQFNPGLFGKEQPSFGVPEQVIPKVELGSNLTQKSLYKIKFHPGQVLRTEPIPTKQGTGGTQRDIKQTTVPSTSFGPETISKWHINGAKEILLYTGGGALESLLKRFNTSLFCQFLLGELQTLRKHYKNQIVVEYNTNQIAGAQTFDYQRTNQPESQNVRSVFSKFNLDMPLPFSSKSRATEHTFSHKKRDLGLKSVVTEKSANLFCRRIYRTTRRLKIVQLLMRSKRRPEWMMISVLPVLPPDLRPVLQMGDNLIVASDLNTLYQRVIYRNNRHYKGRFLDFHFVSSIHRLVQDAVDRLIENGKGGSPPFLTPGGRPLKSLSDILKGKRGRFRFNLLGKRVDFSGRSVIVVDPNLQIHECGLPKEMALELYKYLLIRQLLLQKRVSSIVHAKKVIKQRKPFIWDILRQIIYYHPLLLNRAPTLHRLGIQAFQPKLTLGNAILLHPLVCAGFNADFDGDQMGVHLPLSPQARAEAWDLLWSRNNFLSPATGQPILLPSQDMVLGFYYMTSLLPYGTKNKGNAVHTKPSLVSTRSQKDESVKTSASPFNTLLPKEDVQIFSTKKSLSTEKLVGANSGLVLSGKSSLEKSYNSVVSNQGYRNQQVDGVVVHVFSDPFQVIYAYQNNQIDIHTPIWLKWAGKSENGEKSQTPLELRINAFGDQTQMYPTHKFQNQMDDVNASLFSFHIRTTVGRVLVNNLIRDNY